MKRHLLFTLSLYFLLLTPCAPALAEAIDPAETEPASVFTDARMSIVEGEVLLQGVSELDAITAVQNHLIVEGDRVLSMNDGRCEIQCDYWERIRVWRDTKLDIKRLDRGDDRFVLNLFLMVGSIDIYSRPDERLTNFTFDVATPSGMVRLGAVSQVRIDVSSGGATTIKVRDGVVEVLGGKRSVRVGHNQSVTIEPSSLLPDPKDFDPQLGDDFDSWIWDLNQRIETTDNSDSKTAAASATEAELADHGEWMESEEYGRVWRPNVWDGWSPYYYGTWSWSAHYGYYWIPSEPWGWYPFHFGFWTWIPGYGWAWIPGSAWGPAWVWWYHDHNHACWIPRHPHDHYRHIRWEGKRPYNARFEQVKALVTAPISAIQTGAVSYYERRSIDESVTAMQFTANPREVPALRMLESMARRSQLQPPEIGSNSLPDWVKSISRGHTRSGRLLNDYHNEFQRSGASPRPIVKDDQAPQPWREYNRVAPPMVPQHQRSGAPPSAPQVPPTSIQKPAGPPPKVAPAESPAVEEKSPVIKDEKGRK